MTFVAVERSVSRKRPAVRWMRHRRGSVGVAGGNRKGYAGYENDGVLANAWVYHVRHRPYHGGLGRWMIRDPNLYIEGANLYRYGLGSPLVVQDPFGLESIDLRTPSNGSDIAPGNDIMDCAPRLRPVLARGDDDKYPDRPDGCIKKDGETWCNVAARVAKEHDECMRKIGNLDRACNDECRTAWALGSCGYQGNPNYAKHGTEYCSKCPRSIVPSCYEARSARSICGNINLCVIYAQLRCGEESIDNGKKGIGWIRRTWNWLWGIKQGPCEGQKPEMPGKDELWFHHYF